MPARLSSSVTEARAAIGQRIRQHRLEVGLSLEELARRVTAVMGAVPPYDRRHAAKWEGGAAPLPPPMLDAIATALGCDPWDLHWTAPAAIPHRARLLLVSFDRCVPDALSRNLQGGLEFEIRSWTEFTYRAKRGKTFRAPVIFRPGDLDADRTEVLAGKVRARWEVGMAPIADVVQTLEDAGFVFRHVVPESGHPDVAASGVLHGYAGVCWYGRLPSNPDEAGKFRIRILAAALKAIALKSVRPCEASALVDAVAAAVLLPKVGMSDHLGGACNSVTSDNVLALAGRYGLPSERVIDRLIETGIIDVRDGHRLRRSIEGSVPVVRRETSIRTLLLPQSQRAVA